MYKQQTIKKEIRISGIGIHSGLKSEVVFKPAPINFGIVFVKHHISDNNYLAIKSSINHVVDTENQISLGKENRRVQTIEHILSALYALKISNCMIEVFNREVPIMDGSSYPFVQAIKEAGIQEQNEPADIIRIPHPIWITEGDKYLVILPSQNQEYNFHISYNHPDLKDQSLFVECLTPEYYEKEISKARTFGFFNEWEYLKSKGLALGASLNNTVVFSQQGVMNNNLNYADEPVRHKLLDLIGDFALLNKQIIGRFIASKTGHSMDVALVRKIKKLIIENRFSKKDIQENYKRFEQEVAFLL
jgi:UDP-3-O-[3-hydroxymyristoyl] N-acetylglucosamine deacetylase